MGAAARQEHVDASRSPRTVSWYRPDAALSMGRAGAGAAADGVLH